MIKKNIVLLMVSVLFFNGCRNAKDARSNTAFESFNSLKGAVVSGLVVDMESGEVLAARNEDIRMTPASLSKIFTTSAALYILGPEFRYKTVIAKSGRVVKGTLNGDLLVIGGGDPALGSKYFNSTQPEAVFDKILKDIKKAGIRSVSGKLVIVSGYFSPPAYPSLRLWEDMSNYYGAPPSGLTFMDNIFKVALKSPVKRGERCSVVSIKPDIDIELDCRVVSSASKKDSAYIYGYPGLRKWYIDGSIPAGRNSFVVKGAMPFPEKVFGRELLKHLKNGGITVHKLSFENDQRDRVIDTIGTVYSPPLSSVIKQVNKKSINLFADHLFLTLAKKYGKADWDNARKVFNGFWKKSIGDNDIFLHDGSGLSPYNCCTPEDMVKVLEFNAGSRFSKEFKTSLSVSGVDGTLKRIWNSSETKGMVTGKSGYMKGVLGYAGYITTKTGRQLSFCIIVNRFTEPVSEVRSLIEKEIEKIIVQN